MLLYFMASVIMLGDFVTSAQEAANSLMELAVLGAAQSSIYGTYHLKYCYDGNKDTVCHTNSAVGNWIQVDLGVTQQVQVVQIFNRWSITYSLRLASYEVWLSNDAAMPASKCFEGNVGSDGKVALGPWAVGCAGQGRYVRIVLPGENYLSLGDVQVFGTASSLVEMTVLGVAQSSMDAAQYSTYCHDGNVNTHCQTLKAAGNWIQADLGVTQQVQVVRISNIWNTDASLRLGSYEVWLSNDAAVPASKCFEGNVGSDGKVALGPWAVGCAGQGRYVRIVQLGDNHMNLAEVQVFGAASSLAQLTVLGAAQSSIYGTYHLKYCYDGNKDTLCLTNTAVGNWIQVDLGVTQQVQVVQIFNQWSTTYSRLCLPASASRATWAAMGKWHWALGLWAVLVRVGM